MPMRMNSKESLLRRTRSVCPVCLQPLEAQLVCRENAVYLTKCCPQHGSFETPVWRNKVDFEQWRSGAAPLAEGEGLHCPDNCGICAEHEQETCCALLEVTSRCNLRCSFCFANGGESAEQPPLEKLKGAVREIVEKCGNPLLQLSGGEPTMRDDLAELIRFAKENGCRYVQLNSNGVRLARQPEYTRSLAEAGLDFVFMQFDGVDDSVYRRLRGMELLETKLRAIEVCGACGLGVTLVPTVVRGVNEMQLGDIVRLGAAHSPTVRGVHFQPVSYFGRYPANPDTADRYTLDELIAGLCEQTGLAQSVFRPSRCDHPMCGFHASLLVNPDGSLRSLATAPSDSNARTTACQNREYIARRWQRPKEQQSTVSFLECGRSEEIPDMQTFLRMMRTSSFTLTAMAFQDAMNLDIERLRRCSLHVYDNGKIKPFCAKYLSAVKP